MTLKKQQKVMFQTKIKKIFKIYTKIQTYDIMFVKLKKYK